MNTRVVDSHELDVVRWVLRQPGHSTTTCTKYANMSILMLYHEDLRKQCSSACHSSTLRLRLGNLVWLGENLKDDFKS